MTGFVFLFLFLELFYHSDATRCFDCRYVPIPHDCTRVRECDSGEYCYTEQIVTGSGNVVYNTGCLSKSKCAAVNLPLAGKRSGKTNRDSTDISICTECCADNFCNMKGCGATVIPIQQRGPYCYNCDSVSDPKSCESVSACIQDEVCILITREVKRDLQRTTYKSQCGGQSTCVQLSTTMNTNTCSVSCCGSDFCNDHHDCGIIRNITMTTKTTIPTEMPTKSGETTIPSTISPQSSSMVPFHCKQRDGYVRLHLRNTSLCVHIINQHATWEEAQSRCKQNGGDLVVLDTHDKAILMRHTIREELCSFYNLENSAERWHPQAVLLFQFELAFKPIEHMVYFLEYNEHHSYWIGAKDFHDNDHFYWINNQRLMDSNTEWGSGQPDTHTQDCDALMRNIHFHWNNRDCSEDRNFICEQQ